MNHLIVSRQYPPAPNSGGGIATYVRHMAELLVARGETVHVIGQLWPGATRRRETRASGRLTIHRVDPSEPLGDEASPFGGFSGHAAMLAESLIETAGIDIVEAQEYEAPTYPLMVRRSAGLGPRRHVPILVHLHTPTEFVYKQNEWEQDLRNHESTISLERSVIRAADALVCPSRFLAQIAESHYQLESGAVNVIPYPMGDTVLLTRDESTWRNGTICYAGRLEPRKGVIEWMDAAVAVAEDGPVHFTLIGADTSAPDSGVGSMLTLLRARIPVAVRPRFSFPGAVPRHDLPAHLAQARIGVVPSRWENFPYACIEAMASGLPVLVSPTGGMAEMIEDGRTGWIAEGSDARSLAIALRRALATPPSVLAEMGTAAGVAIRSMCDDDRVVRRQLELRRRVIDAGCRRSADIAAILLPVPSKPNASGPGRRLDALSEERTMTALDILRASPRQQLAIVRRALSEPSYVAQWLAWQGRRAIRKVLQKAPDDRVRENHYGAITGSGKSE